MKKEDINIRDPFVLFDNGKYYLYGTRAANFGRKTGGFDVYVSEDLEQWSEPEECFDSEKWGFNSSVNWAPEVHFYKGGYYLFATFSGDNGLRESRILKSDSPLGPFEPYSCGGITPKGWECLDATLYVDGEGKPYAVFCHEHTQIIDGTICYIRLTEDLKEALGEPVCMFSGSSPQWADKKVDEKHFITDGPFMYRTASGELLMIWSTFVNEKYCQCVARSDNGEIDGNFVHLPILIDNDGGHGMIFKFGERLMLTFHSPNKTGFERPVFKEIVDMGDYLKLKD